MLRIWFLSLGVLLIGCSGVDIQEPSLRSVKCEVATAVGHHSDQSVFSGRVKAALEGGVSFRVAGQIARLSVVQGSFVRKGALLAQLDDRDYRTQLSATEAEYRQIKSEADRIIALYGKQSVTSNDYDKAVYGLQQIEAKLAAHRDAQSDTRLLAPYDGYIDKIYFNQGEMVNAGMAVVSMISSERPEIEINIPAGDYLKRSQFRSATATIHGFGDTLFALKLIGMNPNTNLNQLHTVRFSILGDLLPSPGMSAMVRMSYQGSISAMMQIPVTALHSDEVWVVNSDTVQKRRVVVVAVKTDGTAWVEGLEAGEMVVAAGTQSLKEGMRVKVLSEVSKTNEGGLL